MHKRNLPYRKSIRLKGWDYRNPGLYFVTICTKNRRHHFGEIRDGMMGFTVPGALANYYWTKIVDQFPSVILDEHIVMPNHIHGIIGITETPDDENVGPAIYGGPENQATAPMDGGRTDNTDSDSVISDGTDAMNRVPTESPSTGTQPTKPPTAGSPIHRDPATNVDTGLSKTNPKKSKGGITKDNNPMLYKTHLGKIVRWFKGRCTYEIRDRDYHGFAWQSKFYDHIIRNEKSLKNIRQYIFDNPLRWQIDRENPDRVHEIAVEYAIGKKT